MRCPAVAKVIEVEQGAAVVAGSCPRLPLSLPLVGLVLKLFEIVVLATEAEGAARCGASGKRIVTRAAVPSLLAIPEINLVLILLSQVACSALLADVA